MQDWADDFASSDGRNNYTEPLRADADRWSIAPVEKILFLWGEYKMFRDDTVVFAETLKKAGTNVEASCPLEVYIDCILDAETGRSRI